MTLHIATGANAGYMGKIRPYLNTLVANGHQAKRWLVCVKCAAPDDLPPQITGVRAGDEHITASPAETECLQNGAFVEVIPGDDDDVIIFTDGDIFMQRPFSDDELQGLENWPEDVIGMSYNAGPQQTLLHEALSNLRPRVDDGQFLNRWGRTTIEVNALNAGVMVGRRSAYRKLYAAHVAQWDDITAHLGHHARQQWLIAYLLATTELEAQILPYTFHMHAHYKLPPGALIASNGEAYFNNRLVAFWHLPMWARGK